MSAAVTFGSIGDILAICQILAGLAKALNGSQDSAKHYQALVTRLEVYNNTMLQTALLLQTYQAHVELVELNSIATQVTKDSQGPLVAFKDKIISKYGGSLGIQAASGPVSTAKQKIIWHMLEKSQAVELENMIHRNNTLLTEVIVVATAKLARLDHISLTAKILKMDSHLQVQSIKVDENMAKLCAMMESQDLNRGESLSDVRNQISHTEQILQMLNDMRSTLTAIGLQIAAQQAAPMPVQRYWQQEPITFEDALGRECPVHLEFIDSWETFEAVIRSRFKDLPGHSKVLKNEYVLRDSSIKAEISRSMLWRSAFLPGRRIDMTMVFNNGTPAANGALNQCPRCHCRSSENTLTEVQCKSCRVYFQRLEEIEDLHAENPVTRPPPSSVWLLGEQETPQINAQPEVIGCEDENSQLLSFKRVKVITKLRRWTSIYPDGLIMRRGPWSQIEDAYLMQLIHTQGPMNWVRIAQLIGSRSPKQCRERYHQNLRPSLNHEPITPEEGLQIERLVTEMGQRWDEISRRLNGRSPNAIKNWWNGSINRRRPIVRRRESPPSNEFDGIP